MNYHHHLLCTISFTPETLSAFCSGNLPRNASKYTVRAGILYSSYRITCLDGWTALLYSAEKSPIWIVKLLIEKGADINSEDKNSKKPVEWALGHDTTKSLCYVNGSGCHNTR
jgi:ankyrin repeat protein